MGTYRLDQLFNRSSVAVVGASPDAGSLGGLVMKGMRGPTIRSSCTATGRGTD